MVATRSVVDGLLQVGQPARVASRTDDRHAHVREFGCAPEADTAARTRHDRYLHHTSTFVSIARI